MAISSFMAPLGSPAPAFSLPSLNGCSVSLDDLPATPALLVAFLSNHCPYVRRIERPLGVVTAEYHDRGLTTVAICSNDVERYPDDDSEHLLEQSDRAGFEFLYLTDPTQAVAHAYRAACTPDLFLYDGERRLAYRGEFDRARPGNETVSDGSTLRTALDLVLAGKAVPEPHTPSLGCGIKWRPGNEPG